MSVFAAATRFSNFAAALSALGPIVGLLIDTVEKLVPHGEGSGAVKFQHVLDGAKNYLVGMGNAAAAVEQLLPAIAMGINQAVDAYKGRITPQGQPIPPQAAVEPPAA